DQVAISNGRLQREWTEGDRHYFHYQMNRPMPLAYIFTSGEYGVQRDRWEDIELEVYYHPDHAYNIDRILAGMKASLEYCSQHFSPYQFDHLRMVEFSQINGATAHGFPGTIPAGEGAGFIAKIDDTDDTENDYAFGTTVHEVAHQWWGNQVIPADTRGAKMIVESLAEYVNVMVKKHYKNETQSLLFVKENLEGYLSYRSRLRRAESPLSLSYPKENYLHYPKGAVALHSLANYIGEDTLNHMIKTYVDKVAFQTETYTTSLELIEMLKAQTPDSLRYLLHDWFETVTLYDNQVVDWTSEKLADGQHEIKVDFLISKYRLNEAGEKYFSDNGRDSLSHQHMELLHSLPLRDYIEIGVYDEKEELIFLDKKLIQQIDNQLVIKTKTAPKAVVIDPHYLLADTDLRNNRRE
ncbi:MAG: M1 family metallopeptidase, partial [Saprospiraceae bacterium]